MAQRTAPPVAVRAYYCFFSSFVPCEAYCFEGLAETVPEANCSTVLEAVAETHFFSHGFKLAETRHFRYSFWHTYFDAENEGSRDVFETTEITQLPV
jgi:hypothetical protein